MKNEAKKIDNKQGNGVLPCVSGSFSWKKLLHNFCYWTNPFYMLSTDLKNSPKAQAFIVEHFGHILEPIVIWLSKMLYCAIKACAHSIRYAKKG